MNPFEELIPRGLVVSCQLDRNEPLHTPQHCALFAAAAELGGAVAVRGEGIENLKEIRATTRLPMIGCVRGAYADGQILVTPEMTDVDRLVRLGADVVAIDATLRERPGGMTGIRFLEAVRKRYPLLPILADISTLEEGVQAVNAGAGALSTVLFGRTEATYASAADPAEHFALVLNLASTVSQPVMAEGFVWNTSDASAAMEAGAHGVIVGGAITRPRILTRLFVDAVESGRK